LVDVKNCRDWGGKEEKEDDGIQGISSRRKQTIVNTTSLSVLHRNLLEKS